MEAISHPLASSEVWAKCTSDCGFTFLQLLEAVLVHVAGEDASSLQCRRLVGGGGPSLLYSLALFLLRLLHGSLGEEIGDKGACNEPHKP